MKAAAISELYLLNENTNGSSSFLARRQGRQQGVGVGVGVGAALRTPPEHNHLEEKRKEPQSTLSIWWDITNIC